MSISRNISASPYTGFDQQFIAGAWQQGRSSKRTIDTNPYTGEILVEIPQATAEEVDVAYGAARNAQKDWACLLPSQRAGIMRRAAEIMETRHEEVVSWIIRESGGTRIKAQLEWSSVHAVILESTTLPYFVEGHILPSDVPGKETRVYRRPVGVVGVISPWNWPLQLTARSIFPALAVGNSVVVKPASDTPITGGLLLAKILEEAGLPAGVLSVLVGAGSEIGDAFVKHPIPRVISFTGSTPVGRNIAKLAAEGPVIKRLELELGGNSPFVVLSDADLDQAVEAAVFGKFLHQGQICMIANRFILVNDIYDAFAEKFVARVRELKVGDPNEPDTLIGPIINQSQLKRLEELIKEARNEGVKILLDGKPEGLVMPPHIFGDVANNLPLAQEELFGPLAPLIRAKDEEEALELANATTYGLSSCVFTRDLERGWRFAQKVEAGMTHINDQSVNDMPFSPFGGEKNSGIGRFNGRWAVDAFSTDHWITIQHQPRSYPSHAELIAGPWAGG